MKSTANADDFMMVLNSHRNRDQIVLTDSPGYFFGEIPEKEQIALDLDQKPVESMLSKFDNIFGRALPPADDFSEDLPCLSRGASATSNGSGKRMAISKLSLEKVDSLVNEL